LTALPNSLIFGSPAEASAFFERGSLGYSVTAKPGEFDGLELRSFTWQVQPLAVERVESSFFEDRALYPTGSGEFDCALLMRGIDHEWHSRESLSVEESTVTTGRNRKERVFAAAWERVS
jgi:hypothetical protein